MEFLNNIIDNSQDELSKVLQSILGDLDCKIKVYSSKSDMEVIANNLEFRKDMLSAKGKIQITELLQEFEKSKENEIVQIELFGIDKHIILYLNSSLSKAYGYLEIEGTNIEELLELESKYDKLGLKLDGRWKPIDSLT